MIQTSRTGIAYGSGYRYLTRTVAAGDGDLKAADALLRYYDSHGTPPGRWLGSGLAGFGSEGDAGLGAGDKVTEEQMGRLFGTGTDPITDAPLGVAPRVLDPLQERIAARTDSLPETMSEQERADAVERITREEKKRSHGQARAGFDLTFTLPKSVSALWAVADAGVQAQIVAAHHEAIAEVIALLERDVVMTRIGAAGIAQVGTRGLIAAAFDHYDSRAGDPHLHTHVVVANRVQGLDGKWRTLDSRAMYHAVVAMSRTHDALFADRLARRLPVVWQERAAGPRGTTVREIAGVPRQLTKAFSQRREQIVTAREAARDAVAREGGAMSERASRDLDVATWRATREKKAVRTLAELTDSWRSRAVRSLADSGLLSRTVRARMERMGLAQPTGSLDAAAAAVWVSSELAAGQSKAAAVPVLRAEDLTAEMIQGYAAATLEAVQTRRATWTRWNLHSEAAHALGANRFATAADLEAAITAVVDTAVEHSETISTPTIAHTPLSLRRADGTSILDARHSAVYTSTDVLAAEDYLLDRVRTTNAPACPGTVLADVLATRERPLGADQADAVERVVTSGRGLDVLVGPAGAGKTTTLAGLRAVWEAEHGEGSVIGLAPSAAAAAVLGTELGIETDNTAKWLVEQDRQAERHVQLRRLEDRARRALNDGRPAGHLLDRIEKARTEIHRWQLRPGQLLIVDEASLAGTFALQRLARAAQDAGAKMLLVGDPHQLSAVEAGGAFGMLCHTLGQDAPELTQVHRFRADWEAAASLKLRVGDADVLATYNEHGRIHDGDLADMLDSAYNAWLADTREGRRALLIASDTETVRTLNTRAQADLVKAGTVRPGTIELADETTVGVGDVIVTRENKRTLATSANSWVKNGDRWKVLDARADGSLVVRREKGGRSLLLPAYYVAASVELGYASTTHRAQGSTVDTAHAVIAGESTTRDGLYVAATRGRAANHFWVATSDDETDHTTAPEANPTGLEVLERALASPGTDRSAHQVRDDLADAASSITRLDREYETIAAHATEPRWRALLETTTLTEDQMEEVTGSPAWGALQASLRLAQARGLDVETALPDLVRSRPLEGGEDLAALLHHRLDTWAASKPDAAPPEHTWLLSLLPRVHTTDPDAARALREREALITRAANHVLDHAVATGQPWATPPTDRTPATLTHWRNHMLTVATYRAKWQVTTTTPLGVTPRTDRTRAGEYQRAAAALHAAHHPPQPHTPEPPTSPGPRRARARLAQDRPPITSEQAKHWRETLEASASSPAEARAVHDAPAWGALCAALQRAHDAGLDVEHALAGLIASRPLTGADDPAAVLHHRLSKWANSQPAAATSIPDATDTNLPEETTDPEPRREEDPVPPIETDTAPAPDEGGDVAPLLSEEVPRRVPSVDAVALADAIIVTSDAWDWWQAQAREDGAWTREHLAHRGLDIAHGMAPPTWDGLVTHLRELGYTPEQMINAGVATTTRDGRTIDRFRDRLVIPVYNASGYVVGVTARANPDTADERTPKYLNTPETAAYAKRQTLYGLDALARERLAAGARPVLVEGPMDVAAVNATGRGDLVPLAPCGTALTSDQLALIRAAGGDLNRAVVAFDADTAGHTAAARAWENLDPTEAAHATRLALPEGTDPADLIATGQPDQLAAAIDHAEPLTLALIRRGIEQNDTSRIETRVALARAAAAVLARTDADTALTDTVSGLLARELDLDPETFSLLLAEATAPEEDAAGSVPAPAPVTNPKHPNPFPIDDPTLTRPHASGPSL